MIDERSAKCAKPDDARRRRANPLTESSESCEPNKYVRIRTSIYLVRVREMLQEI